MPTDDYGVVLTTAASKDDARTIAKVVLKRKLAACVQLVDIEGLYTWEGQFVDGDEVLLLIKTRAELYDQLTEVICSVHQYETPEIVLLPIANGLSTYLHWIDQATDA